MNTFNHPLADFDDLQLDEALHLLMESMPGSEVSKAFVAVAGWLTRRLLTPAR